MIENLYNEGKQLLLKYIVKTKICKGLDYVFGLNTILFINSHNTHTYMHQCSESERKLDGYINDP